MDEETFNLSIRKYLKMVGVNSQREIEQAVAKAIAAGGIQGTETLPVTMTLEIAQLKVQVKFDVMTQGLAHIKEGRLRALAVTTATRSETLPDVPTRLRRARGAASARLRERRPRSSISSTGRSMSR